jgi:hypothetical protein
VSVQIHYPKVYNGSSGTYKRISLIKKRTSLISRKDLIGLPGWPGMRSRDKLQKGQLRLGKTSLGKEHD